MSKTILIVGAGASCEVDFPSGEKLVEDIAEMSRINFDPASRSESPNDPDFFRIAQYSFNAKFPSLRATDDLIGRMRELSAGVVHAQSIDNFLALHEDKEKLVFLGKLAIAYTIGNLERDSGLYLPTTRQEAMLQRPQMPIAKWYGRFFKALTSECRFNELPSRLQNLCIVCFNYDRNIEQYLRRAIQSVYIVDERAAATVLENLTIWHPYGSLGQLPMPGQSGGIAYGQRLGDAEGVNQMIGIAEGLRTFSEGSTDINQSPANRVPAFFRESNKIVSLGFGYLPANMRLLRQCYPQPSIEIRFSRRAFGTCYGASEFDRDLYTSELADVLGANTDRVLLSNTTCADLFREYSGALRFA